MIKSTNKNNEKFTVFATLDSINDLDSKISYASDQVNKNECRTASLDMSDPGKIMKTYALCDKWKAKLKELKKAKLKSENIKKVSAKTSSIWKPSKVTNRAIETKLKPKAIGIPEKRTNKVKTATIIAIINGSI